MFGGQSPSQSSNNLQSSQFMRQVDRNNSHLQLLSSLFLSSKTVYLDPNRHFMLMQTTSYHQLIESMQKNIKHNEELMRQVHEGQMQKAAIKKELYVLRDILSKSKQNQADLVKINSENYENYLKLQQQHRNSMIQIDLLRDRLASRQIVQKNQQEASNIVKPAIQKASKEVQTGLDSSLAPILPQEQVGQNQLMHSAPQTQVYNILQTKIGIFAENMHRKLTALQQQESSVEKWRLENQVLKEENQNLKQQMNQINLQQQKLKIWKESVHGLVAKVQSSVLRQNNQPLAASQQNGQQLARLRVQVIELRGRLVQMRRSVRTVQQLMQQQQQVNEEGPVVSLVQLSQKVKGLVKGMLLQVQSL